MYNLRLWIGVGLAYLLMVRLLRYRRRAQLQRLEAQDHSTYSTMTFATAQHIVRELRELEFPFTYEKALQFALFRTYGIPSISRLLVKTGLLSRAEHAAKRYVDTGVLLAGFIARDWGGADWVEAVARMNCIHELYRGAGITDADLLYTLAMFTREPVRWIDNFEWRVLTPIEKLAQGVFWKGIGDAMGIPYTGLPSQDSGKGWRDGLHWLEEITAWSHIYEEQHMVPDQTNFDTAENTTAILLWTVPKAAKPLGKQAVSALMDDRLRAAMKYDVPPLKVVKTVYGLLYLRRSLLMHFALPRPRFLPDLFVLRDKSPHGTFYAAKYDALPYYVRPTFANRWGLGAWVRRLQGLPVPGDEGDKYHPQGFKMVDVGPSHGKNGQKAMEESVMRVGKLDRPKDFGLKA